MQSKYTEALKQALTELLWYEEAGLGRISSCDAIHTIREALADQPAQWLEEALFECIKASGIIRKDITGLSVTELLFFSQDLKRMLAAAPQPAHQEPVAHIRDEALERLKPPIKLE